MSYELNVERPCNLWQLLTVLMSDIESGVRTVKQVLNKENK